MSRQHPHLNWVVLHVPDAIFAIMVIYLLALFLPGGVVVDIKEAITRWDRLITVCVIIAIPLLVMFTLFFIEADRRVSAIQKNRAELTYIACIEQNTQNANATRAVRDTFEKAVREGASPDQLATIQSATQSVIDALAPTRNCRALVMGLFGYVPSGQ